MSAEAPLIILILRTKNGSESKLTLWPPTLRSAIITAKELFYLPADSTISLQALVEGTPVEVAESTWIPLKNMTADDSVRKFWIVFPDENSESAKRKVEKEKLAAAAEAKKKSPAYGSWLIDSHKKVRDDQEDDHETESLFSDATERMDDSPDAGTATATATATSTAADELTSLRMWAYRSCTHSQLEVTCDPRSTTIGQVEKLFEQEHAKGNHDPLNCHKKKKYCSLGLQMDFTDRGQGLRESMTVNEWLEILRKTYPERHSYRVASLRVEGWQLWLNYR